MIEQLKEALHYDPKTGVFRWKKDVNSRVKKGDIAGCFDKEGYRVLRFKTKQYFAHRLAWLFTYEYWPKEIDHINRNKADNRIKNLRECTRSENSFNKDISIRNTSGIKGVSWDKVRRNWLAQIYVKGKAFNIGRFATKQEATKARKQAEKILL